MFSVAWSKSAALPPNSLSNSERYSSMASSCDHIAHVRTQAPYALGMGTLAILVGNVPTALGLSPFLSLSIGVGAIVGGILWLGKVVDDGERERS